MAISLRSEIAGLAEKAISTPSVHQRPRGTQHAAFADALWIVFSVHKIVKQNAQNQGKSGQTSVEKEARDTFKFLAPTEIMENIGHDYEEYESIASRLSSKIAMATKAKAETVGLGEGGVEVVKKFVSGDAVANIGRNVISAVGKGGVIYHKFDAALVYSSTPRREYQFLFNLIDEGNPRLDIIDVVKRLERYSSATAGRPGSSEILPPYSFNLRTEPGGLITIPRCVLTAIQPTYRGPYRDGYPSYCELTLSFKDLDPLYSDSEGLAATKAVTITSSLRKHLPGIDKFNKLQSIVDRAAQSATEYDIKYNEGALGEQVDAGKKYIGGQKA